MGYDPKHDIPKVRLAVGKRRGTRGAADAARADGRVTDASSIISFYDGFFRTTYVI